MSNVVKDIGEIWTRLFDHRPFLNGEIKLFLHEFEEKRDNREVDALFQILQNLTEIKYSQIDKIKLGADAYLPPLKQNIDECIKISNRVLEKEEINKSNTSLEKKRKLRSVQWDNFIKDIAKKCEKVDKAFEEKERDLHDYYLSLEKKLCISSSHSSKSGSTSVVKNITTIKDPTVRIKPSEELLRLLKDKFKKKVGKLPENIKRVLEKKEALLKGSDIEWLDEYLKGQREMDSEELLKGKELYDKVDKIIGSNFTDFDFDGFIEEKNKNKIYLHDLLKGSQLILPENEKIERNPLLAARIERLKKEQADREYEEMTKNVAGSKKHVVEDTISYQMNMMNRHLIAVAQILISMGAGFAFGFLGIEMIIGELNFGFRLLLGITCSLIIAIAEFYFLAKQLNEEENQNSKQKKKSTQNSAATTTFQTKGKLHKD